MTTIYFIVSIFICSFSYLLIVNIYRTSKIRSLKRKIKKQKFFQEKAESIIKKIEQANKYPRFIPFYEWHGFIKGLHPDNRLWFLTGGKEGIKPKKIDHEQGQNEG